MLEVVAELGAFGFLAGHQAGAEGGLVLQEGAQPVEQRGVFGEALHEDVLGAFQHGLHIGETLLGVDEALGLALRVQFRIAEQRVGQFAEAGFQGDLPLGAALLLVGQVEVFQAGLGVGQLDFAFQLGGQLALLLDAGQDRATALLQFAQVAQAFFQVAQLGVVQAAGDFLAVAGNEGHGRTFVEQGHGGGHLLRAYGQFFGDAGVDIHVISWVDQGKQAGPARKGGSITSRAPGAANAAAGPAEEKSVNNGRTWRRWGCAIMRRTLSREFR